MRPLYSIIIPVYNAQDWIEECLRSVISQSFKDFEIVIINDGSTDDSRNLIQSFQKEHKDFLWNVIDQENFGLGAARNTAVKNSIGKYLAFLDADDYWSHNKLETINELISANSNATWVYHGIFERMVDGELRTRKLNQIQSLNDFLVNGNPITPSATIILKELFLKHKGFDENRDRVEDLGLWIRLLSNDHLPLFINQSLTVYRMGSGLTANVENHLQKVLKVVSEESKQNNIDPDLVLQFKSRKMYELARQYQKMGEFKNAIKYYQKCPSSLKGQILMFMARMHLRV